MRIALLFTLAGSLSAQLIPAGQPVPKGPNPPVVFVNGYQAGCIGSDFASNFDMADQVMQAAGIVTLYFDNCTVSAPAGRRNRISKPWVRRSANFSQRCNTPTARR